MRKNLFLLVVIRIWTLEFLCVLLIDIFIGKLKLPQDHVSTLSKLQYLANEQACQIVFKRILNPSALIFDHLLSFVLFSLLQQLWSYATKTSRVFLVCFWTCFRGLFTTVAVNIETTQDSHGTGKRHGKIQYCRKYWIYDEEIMLCFYEPKLCKSRQHFC